MPVCCLRANARRNGTKRILDFDFIGAQPNEVLLLSRTEAECIQGHVKFGRGPHEQGGYRLHISSPSKLDIDDALIRASLLQSLVMPASRQLAVVGAYTMLFIVGTYDALIKANERKMQTHLQTYHCRGRKESWQHSLLRMSSEATS